jgi:hypothetical protein
VVFNRLFQVAIDIPRLDQRTATTGEETQTRPQVACRAGGVLLAAPLCPAR